MDLVTHKKKNMKPGATNLLLHTGHFGSIINDSLKISGHSYFELFFAVQYFRENTVPVNCAGFAKIRAHSLANHKT